MFGTEFEYFWVIFTFLLRSKGQLVVIFGFTLLSYYSGVVQVVGEQQYFSSFSVVYLHFKESIVHFDHLVAFPDAGLKPICGQLQPFLFLESLNHFHDVTIHTNFV